MSPIGEHLSGGLADHPLMDFTGHGRRFCYGEIWRTADDELDSIISEVTIPPCPPCSPLDEICAIGLCMSKFCVGYPFGENAFDEKK